MTAPTTETTPASSTPLRRRLSITLDAATVDVLENLAAPTPLTTVQLAALMLTDATWQAARDAARAVAQETATGVDG